MLTSITANFTAKLSGTQTGAISLPQTVRNAPKSIPIGSCSRFIGLKRLRSIRTCSSTINTEKIIVAIPRSIPQTTVIVYGIELIGVTPKSDFTDITTPSVITIKPPK